MATMDEKKFEQKVRAVLAQAVKDGSHFTQRELREKMGCDMNTLNDVMKRIVKNNLTKSLVIDGEVPVWLDRLLKQVGKGVLKAIDERTKEDLAHRKIMADEAVKEAKERSAEYERQLQEKDVRINQLEQQLKEAHTQVGEANGRRAEMESRLERTPADVEKTIVTREFLESAVLDVVEEAASKAKASTGNKR